MIRSLHLRLLRYRYARLLIAIEWHTARNMSPGVELQLSAISILQRINTLSAR